MHNRRIPRWAYALILTGLALLGSRLLPLPLASAVYTNAGSLYLNEALFSPGLAPAAQWDRMVRAGRSFTSALAWDPRNDCALYHLGVLYTLWHDAPSATRALSQAVALNPASPRIHLALGHALAAQGQEERATREWRAAGAAWYFLRQGITLAQEGDHAGALIQYQQALAIDPHLADGYYRLGRALSALGQREEAVAAFESAAGLESQTSPRRYLLQGEVNVARGQWTAALAAFGRAAELAPRDPVPRYRMGWVLYHHLDDPDAAILQFQSSLALDPEHTLSRIALGRVYQEQGDCDQAARWLAPLLSPDAKGGTAGEAHALVGSCMLQQGRTEESLPSLERAVALVPASVQYHLTLAAAYSQARRYHDAIEEYLRVLDSQPDNTEAQRALEELGWYEP